MRFLRFKDLRAVKGIPFSRMHVWRLEREGRFPRNVKIGVNTVAWVEAEIDAWMSARVSSSRDSAS